MSASTLFLIAGLFAGSSVDPTDPALLTNPGVMQSAAERATARSLRLRQSAAELSGLPPLLRNPEVKEALDSGLTATLLARLSVTAGRRNRCLSNLAVRARFDLWDEVYLVQWADDGGLQGADRFESIDRFGMWWRTRALECRFERSPTGPVGAELTVKVVPFSREEELDARGWFIESANQPAPTSNAQGSSLLELLLSSAIRREAVLTFRWQLEIEP